MALRKTPTSSISLLFALLVWIPAANAVDTLDYDKTMAKHYLETNDLDQAAGVIADGLKIAPDDSELLQFKKELAAQQKKANDQKKAEERKAQQEKKRQEVAEKRSEAQLDSSMLCICRQQEAKLNEALQNEKEIGATAGVVNKVTLHSLGAELQAIRKYERYLEAKGQSGKCARQFDEFEKAECMNRAVNYANERASK